MMNAESETSGIQHLALIIHHFSPCAGTELGNRGACKAFDAGCDPQPALHFPRNAESRRSGTPHSAFLTPHSFSRPISSTVEYPPLKRRGAGAEPASATNFIQLRDGPAPDVVRHAMIGRCDSGSRHHSIADGGLAIADCPEAEFRKFRRFRQSASAIANPQFLPGRLA